MNKYNQIITPSLLNKKIEIELSNKIELYKKVYQDQGGVSFKKALREIKDGKKKSCWSWYIFPMYVDPTDNNRSSISKKYSLDEQEKLLFLNNEYLRNSYTTMLTTIYNNFKHEQPDFTNYLKELLNGDYWKFKASVREFHDLIKDNNNDELNELKDILKEIVELK